MKKTISIVSSFILAIFLTSCSSLQSSHIVGEEMEFLEDDIGNETVWKIEDEIYHVRIADTNRLVATIIEWDSDKKTHSLTTEEIIVSHLDDLMFLNVKIDDLYNIHYMVPSDGDRVLLFYGIDTKALQQLVPNGVVETDKDSEIYELKGSKEEIDRFILKNYRSIFDPSKATVGHLISGEL